MKLATIAEFYLVASTRRHELDRQCQHKWVSGPGGGNEEIVCLHCGEDHPATPPRPKETQ